MNHRFAARGSVAVCALRFVLAAPTVHAALDPFVCYKDAPSSGAPRFATVPGVTLVDAFASSTVDVKKPRALCVPENGAPESAAHLNAYRIVDHAPGTLPSGVLVHDQFNPAGIRLDVIKPLQLLVPSSVSATPPSTSVDHFTCYKVRPSRGSPRFTAVPGVALDDHFGPMTATVKGPKLLCNPADKNGESPAADTHPDRLLCYQIKQTDAVKFVTQREIGADDQFGSQTLDVRKPSQLCVPLSQPTPTPTPTLTPTPTFTPPPVCGDGIRNTLDEECDGADDAACPGMCGSTNEQRCQGAVNTTCANDADCGTAGPCVRTAFFACLCKNIPRERVVEHANADLDNGWTGAGHDSGIVEAGGYVADLYDCDPTTHVCTVGPSCEVPFLGTRVPCDTDANCATFGLGHCRKRRTAVGPYCNLDVQTTCTSDGDCPGPGNFCRKQFHGPPLPLTAGSVSACVVNEFSESVTGTVNLVTGSSRTRVRQSSRTYLGATQDQPCPVCGGFCDGNAGDSGPGARSRCSSDADCPGSFCVTANICGWGPNQDQPCRTYAPVGGTTEFFGTTSVDCPPFPGAFLAALDILFVGSPGTELEFAL